VLGRRIDIEKQAHAMLLRETLFVAENADERLTDFSENRLSRVSAVVNFVTVKAQAFHNDQQGLARSSCTPQSKALMDNKSQ
jgi:hypothetical protein